MRGVPERRRPEDYLAEQYPDVRVVTTDLPPPLQGCVDFERRIIWLAKGLTEVQRRCCLAFEIGQLELGPGPADPRLAVMHQRAAAGWAARMLIPTEIYVDCFRHSFSLAEIAEHVGVDLPTLRARIRDATDEEFDAAMVTLAQKSAVG